jgi:hypothetical protein
MKFWTKNWHDDHATVRRGSYPDGTTKLTVLGRYSQILCDATISLEQMGEYPDVGCVFLPAYGDTEGVLQALQDAGIVGRTNRIIQTSTHTRDPLKARPVHECPLLIKG